MFNFKNHAKKDKNEKQGKMYIQFENLLEKFKVNTKKGKNKKKRKRFLGFFAFIKKNKRLNKFVKFVKYIHICKKVPIFDFSFPNF